MSSTVLFESARATADAAGTATAQLAPQRAHEKWRIRRMTIESTSSVLVPELRVYRGAVAPTRIVDSTYDGALAHSDTDITLQTGEALVFQWTGADVGSVCTVTVEGEAIR